ncbi:hypothetical protein C8Q77DRAFT_1025743, partial [Trametes polyzona]
GKHEHRRLKRFYALTNKNLQFTDQVAKHIRRERAVNTHTASELSSHAHRTQKARHLLTRKRDGPLGGANERVPETIPTGSPRDHHQISSEQRNHVDIVGFVQEHQDDPAVQDFALDLRRHLVQRLRNNDNKTGGDYDEEYEPTSHDLSALRIRHDRTYIHKQMRLNYTSYDM